MKKRLTERDLSNIIKRVVYEQENVTTTTTTENEYLNRYRDRPGCLKMCKDGGYSFNKVMQQITQENNTASIENVSKAISLSELCGQQQLINKLQGYPNDGKLLKLNFSNGYKCLIYKDSVEFGI